MRIGTSYFKDKQSAYKYFAYGFTKKQVDKKFIEGQIHTGKPQITDKEKLQIDEDGRYHRIEKC